MDKEKKREIFSRIDAAIPVTLSFRFADASILMAIGSIVAKCLSRMDHIFLLNSVVTILRELVVNAIKANGKRVFFARNSLDIRNPEDYFNGMARFKKEVIGEFELLKDDLTNSDYYVKVFFEFNNNDLKVHIENNCPIIPEELNRINFRIQKAKQFSDFTEAYDEIEDDSEGAGLGIVLTILFLKNMGIHPDLFSISSDGKITVTALTIPSNLRPPEWTGQIKNDIISSIEGIPTFPEHILDLMEMCFDPDSSIEIICEKVMMDPALVADVIKLSNTAGFVSSRRMETVIDAVKTIGLKNLYSILLASNSRRILSQRYDNFEEIWGHCNKTAFYARIIASIKKKSSLSDNAYIGGLLHDLGKIVLLSTDIKLVERIAETVKNRKIVTSTVMEEISIGISHSAIGELIASRWNFPEYLVEVIKCHHDPLRSRPDYRDVVNAVYLANMICGIETRKYHYDYLDEDILASFGINNREEFKKISTSLREKWDNLQKG